MFQLITGSITDVELPEVQLVATSPPYFHLRDYGHIAQFGQEPTVTEYVKTLVTALNRIPLRDDGCMFLNIGDSFSNGSLQGVPWQVALALVDSGWFLRNEIIWHRNRVMPESAKNRFTRCHEQIFLLTKRKSGYKFNADAVREPAKWADDRRAGKGRHVYCESRGDSAHTAAVFIAEDGKRNRRTVWTVETTQAKKHHATYPTDLTDLFVLAGSDSGDLVLDPFSGTGTTGVSALTHGRDYIGVDVSSEFNDIARRRLERCAMKR